MPSLLSINNKQSRRATHAFKCTQWASYNKSFGEDLCKSTVFIQANRVKKKNPKKPPLFISLEGLITSRTVQYCCYNCASFKVWLFFMFSAHLCLHSIFTFSSPQLYINKGNIFLLFPPFLSFVPLNILLFFIILLYLYFTSLEKDHPAEENIYFNKQ